MNVTSAAQCIMLDLTVQSGYRNKNVIILLG